MKRDAVQRMKWHHHNLVSFFLSPRFLLIHIDTNISFLAVAKWHLQFQATIFTALNQKKKKKKAPSQEMSQKF